MGEQLDHGSNPSFVKSLETLPNDNIQSPLKLLHSEFLKWDLRVSVF